jgi:hypothetical protein
MTTNVPQDVIDDANAAKAELTYRCAYADMEICPCEAADSDNCHEQIVHGIKFTARTWGKFAQLRDQRQQGAEPVYQVREKDGTWSDVDSALYLDFQKEKRTLYTTTPQANALVAAAYMKAAEICESVASERGSGEAYGAAKVCAEEILAAIPADAEAALRERDHAMCMKVAYAVRTRCDEVTVPQTDELESIVNSVLGEGGK